MNKSMIKPNIYEINNSVSKFKIFPLTKIKVETKEPFAGAIGFFIPSYKLII